MPLVFLSKYVNEVQPDFLLRAHRHQRRPKIHRIHRSSFAVKLLRPTCQSNWSMASYGRHWQNWNHHCIIKDWRTRKKHFISFDVISHSYWGRNCRRYLRCNERIRTEKVRYISAEQFGPISRRTVAIKSFLAIFNKTVHVVHQRVFLRFIHREVVIKWEHVPKNRVLFVSITEKDLYV